MITKPPINNKKANKTCMSCDHALKSQNHSLFCSNFLEMVMDQSGQLVTRAKAVHASKTCEVWRKRDEKYPIKTVQE